MSAISIMIGSVSLPGIVPASPTTTTQLSGFVTASPSVTTQPSDDEARYTTLFTSLQAITSISRLDLRYHHHIEVIKREFCHLDKYDGLISESLNDYLLDHCSFSNAHQIIFNDLNVEKIKKIWLEHMGTIFQHQLMNDAIKELSECLHQVMEMPDVLNCYLNKSQQEALFLKLKVIVIFHNKNKEKLDLHFLKLFAGLCKNLIVNASDKSLLLYQLLVIYHPSEQINWTIINRMLQMKDQDEINENAALIITILTLNYSIQEVRDLIKENLSIHQVIIEIWEKHLLNLAKDKKFVLLDKVNIILYGFNQNKLLTQILTAKNQKKLFENLIKNMNKSLKKNETIPKKWLKVAFFLFSNTNFSVISEQIDILQSALIKSREIGMAEKVSKISMELMVVNHQGSCCTVM